MSVDTSSKDGTNFPIRLNSIWPPFPSWLTFFLATNDLQVSNHTVKTFQNKSPQKPQHQSQI